MSRGKNFLRVVFMRHGEFDYDRNELTPLGVDQVERAADNISNFDTGKVLIWTSPEERTEQSAGIIAERFDKSGEPQAMGSLSEGAFIQNVFGLIADLRQVPDDARTVIAVTHDDVVKGNGELLGALKLRDNFKTGQICWVNMPDRHSALDPMTVMERYERRAEEKRSSPQPAHRSVGLG